jgi:quinol monooxygenase YgiN
MNIGSEKMEKNVSWIFELTLTTGTAAELKALMVELVEAAETTEPSTLAYEWTLSEDDNICHVHEKYKDSNAALTHLNTFTEKFAARLMALGDATGFTVYGNPSDELREVLKGFNGEYMTPIGGFSR